MFKRSDLRHPLMFLLFALLVFAGCAGDEAVSPNPTGTIQISPAADALATPWTLTGPDSFRARGAGAETLNDLALGTYTIVWADVAGRKKPASETRVLNGDTILALGGDFTPLGGGAVVINCEPNELESPWLLLGPKGLDLLGQGDVKMVDMVPGEYWVSWGPIDGWDAPAGYSQTLVADGVVTFDGVYVALPPEPALPFAGTEDQLMANFRNVYEEMNFASFDELMHPDFIMLLQQSTIEEFPDLGQTLDLAEEMRIAERMFGGVPVTDPDGALVPGISGIAFPVFARQGAWVDTPDNDPIPHTRSAFYDVMIYFDRVGYSTMRVEGMIKFYVAGRDSLHNGTEQVFYEMKGQFDLTGEPVKAVEGASFGSVKALFR